MTSHWAPTYFAILVNMMGFVGVNAGDDSFRNFLWVIPVFIGVILMVFVGILLWTWYKRFYVPHYRRDPQLLSSQWHPSSAANTLPRGGFESGIPLPPGYYHVEDIKSDHGKSPADPERTYNKELTLGSLYPMWNQSSLQASIKAGPDQTPMAPPPIYTPRQDT
ncbi:uncharacterized protein [Ptychodera flava]|uniref:uncharacterized protein n=1 Tax=Ptychodera flava TaxID=63121 RepID=UPI00396A2593